MAPDSNFTRPFFDMMSRRQRRPFCGNKNGVALILVLAALAIITVILVGFTLDMQLEKQASQSSLTSLKSDAAVQAALAHATALLAQNIPPVAHGSPTVPGTPTLSLNVALNGNAVNWWVNPGLLSTQTSAGTLTQIPLYTTLTSTFSGAAYPPTDTAPSDADTTDSATVPAKAVDLNRPTLRNSSVYTVTGSDTANANPMRVYWQYVVQDPTQPHNSATNPYVSRYAFWMEPENSRIDISTAIGKDTTQSLPDAASTMASSNEAQTIAGTSSTIPSCILPTFYVKATPLPMAYGAVSETLGTFFTLGNPASVDLSVLKIPSATTFFSFFDTSKFFNAQQLIQRGNASRGNGDPTPFNLLPLYGDANTPATLDDIEQFKNFVQPGFTTQQGEQFYTDNQFYLTNYSRDPEFNVFGGARLYLNNYTGSNSLGVGGTASYFKASDLYPTYQYFWNTLEPTWLDTTGVNGDTANHPGGGMGRTYLGVLYLSQMMQRTTWPGYAGNSMASKWNSTNPAREADQVAWNLYGLGCSMQDGYNPGYNPTPSSIYVSNNADGYQSKNFLEHWNINNTLDAPGRNLFYAPPPATSGLGVFVGPGEGGSGIVPGAYYFGYGLWSGTASSARYMAEGRSLNVDEFGLNARLVETVPASSAGPALSTFNLRFSFEYDLTLPSGFFQAQGGAGIKYLPLAFATFSPPPPPAPQIPPPPIITGATTLVVSHLEGTISYTDTTGTAQSFPFFAYPANSTPNPASAGVAENAPDEAGKLVIPAYQFNSNPGTPDPATGAWTPKMSVDFSGTGNGSIYPGDRDDICTYVDNLPAASSTSQEYIVLDSANKPFNFPAPSTAKSFTITGLKVRFALLLNTKDQALQVSPLTSPSVSATATQASMESSSTSPFAATFSLGTLTIPASEVPALGTATSPTPYQSFGSYDKNNLIVMKVDDTRLAGQASAWYSYPAPGDFGSSTPSYNGAAPTASQLSKYALPPMSNGDNFYPFGTFNDYAFVSPAQLFFACNGMQSATPWRTLSLQPGGFNGSSGTPMTASRATVPPDYLLLDLFQAPYRYENMNSSQGKININSLIYPSYFSMKRLLPLEALFANTKVAGTTITPGAGNEAESLANDIQAEESTLNGFRYSGELCEVAHLGQYGSTDFQKEGLMRNLSGLITTRSNSFGMWGAAQAIVEQPTGRVTVLSDKRFHGIVERYVWPGVDAFYGNGYANTGTMYPTATSPNNSPGDYLDTIDGPDDPNLNQFSVTSAGTLLTAPSIYTANKIPLNMNVPTLNTLTKTTLTYKQTPLEIANNPLCPYMRYRIVNFRYITD